MRKLWISLIFLVFILQPVAATEIESGYVQATSTGTVTEDIGFRPDYIEFITAQQIESLNFEDTTSTNNNCPQNVNGWSEGSVIFDDTGVEKQFTIGTFRNSDSTDGHTVASSTSDVIKNVYVNENGDQCSSGSELRISVQEPTDSGFKLNIESKYSAYDEIIRYKAYQFPDNMEFDAGMAKVSSEGSMDVNGLGFQPANLHIRAGMQIHGKNIQKDFPPNDVDNALGRSKGYVTFNEDGNVIDQQSIGTASSSENTNAHRTLASDNYVLNLAYVGQNANLLDSNEPSRLEVKSTGAHDDGFSLQVDNKWSETDEVFLYRAWGFSYYEYDVGYKVIDSQGSESFSTDYQGESFEPDAIDIYAEQQVNSINNEYKTPRNSECDNAGGWSNGFYEADDNKQWAMGMGRTSDSQNAHRQAATTTEALINLYSDQDGNDQNCGKFYGEVTSTSSNGFDMDFAFGENFDSNYGKEMVYYRALNFLLAPPTVKSIQFFNSTEEHGFKVVANVSEGSNDIDSCEITAEDENGYTETYSATVNQVNETFSQCIYDQIEYDDNTDWADRHDNQEELIELDVTVKAEDIDGQSSEKTESNTFPNNNPQITGIKFSNYTDRHAFNVSAKMFDPDAVSPEEFQACNLVLDDQDGNQVIPPVEVDHSFGNDSEALCFYSNVNASMPWYSDLRENFEPLEEIENSVTLTEIHGETASKDELNSIPNVVPKVIDIQPGDGTVSKKDEIILNVTAVHSPETTLRAYFYNANTGEFLGKDEKVGEAEKLLSGKWEDLDIGITYQWKVNVSDTYENETFGPYEFLRSSSNLFRTVQTVEHEYSSIITYMDNTETFLLEVENKISTTKNMRTYLEGVNAYFNENGEKSIDYTLEPEETKTFRVTVDPEETGETNLTITSENKDILFNTTETMPVVIKETPVSYQEREVPGIAIPQIFMLVLSALSLYYSQL